MLKLRFCFASLVIISLLIIIGCSGGSNPVAPSGTTDSQITSFDSVPVGVSDLDADGNPLAGYGALGLFEIHLDAESLTGEIQSLRKASLPDVLEVVDISNFLQVAPCFDCVQILSFDINGDGNLVVTIGIKHPFAAGDTLKPISGRNRGDLHVFNVEGLVVAEAASTTGFAGIGEQVVGTPLLNADGYSPYLDGVLDDIFNTTATIHPYKLHFDDYSAGNYDASNPMGFESVTEPLPSGNLVMAMGCDYDYQEYEFDLSGGSIDFIFAVGCTYAVSAAGKIERFTPEYRVPQHLKKAASEVNVRIVDNQLSTGDSTSTADIAIDVVDRSHGVAVGTGLGEMFADSSVGGISLDIPGVLSGVASVTLANTGGTGHDSIDPLTYEITILNEQSAVTGMYLGLVKVVDSYPPGLNTSPLLFGNDGIERVGPTQNPLEGLFAIPEFATYQLFEIEVGGIPNDPPIADLQPDPVDIYEGNTVNFDATASNDPDGTITLYEFDYDWDEVEGNFAADASNATGLVTSDTYDTQGDYTAGLRVTDNLGAVDYDSVPVTVTEWTSNCPDAPYAGNTFNGNFTYDHYIHFSDLTGWELFSDHNIDADMLSTGEGVTIYGDSGYYEGELRIFHTDATSFSTLGADWPGERGVSVDIDSADLIVFVTGASLPHSDNAGLPLSTRIAHSNDYFTVVDPTIGTSSAQNISVGTTIMAIEIDGYDDIWVLDTDNVMHMYDKSNGYAEEMARQFDLDVEISGTFTGLVYDFVIDFHNEAFFILEDTSDKRCAVWRFECDGTYFSDINGHPNPIAEVLMFNCSDSEGIDAADIGIDNLDSGGNHLTGVQDSQIVIVAGYYSGGWGTQVTRVDSELDQINRTNLNSGNEGLSNVFFDQRNNVLWGFQCDNWGDAWIEQWDPPADWQ